MEIMIDGMMCTHCAARVKKALEAVPGVSEVEILLSEKKAIVSGSAQYNALADAVIAAGYQVIPQ